MATRIDVEAAELPAIQRIRAQARDDRGRPMVVVGFENGAQLRYRESDDGVREEWVGPAGDESRVHDRDTDQGPKATALETIGTYLTFDDRARAAFVWGEDNVAVLLGD